MDPRYLEWDYMRIINSMFEYYDGDKHRKNKRFFKALWKILHHDPKGYVSIGYVFNTINDPKYAEISIRSISYGLKRAGSKWLEGLDGDLFGPRFHKEYVRRWHDANDGY